MCVNPSVLPRSVSIDLDPMNAAITLTVERMSMRDVGSSFRVRYDHDSALQLARRDEESLNEIYTTGYTSEIPSRYPLFPPNNSIANTVATSVLQCVHDLLSYTPF